MSHVLEIRGGEPNIRRENVSTAGREYKPGAKDPAAGRYTFLTKHIQIFNVGGNALRLFFSEEDFNNDANYRTIAATTGEWEGPAEAKGVWLKAVGGATDVEMIFYQRRG